MLDLFYHGTVEKEIVKDSNVFVYNFKPGHLASFWSLHSLKKKNIARLMETGMTRTGGNYEYDWRLYSERHERSSIKSSECHTESLFRLPETQLFWSFFAAEKGSLIYITNASYFYPQKHKYQSGPWNITWDLKFDFMIWSEDESKHFQKHVWLAKMDVLPVWLHYTNRALSEDVIKWSL